MLKGVNASEGIGIGKVMLIKELNLDYEKKTITDTQSEIERFRSTLDAYCKKTEAQAENIKNTVGEKEAEIILGHLLMIKDLGMASSIEGNISNGCCAEDAVAQVCDMFIGIFQMAEDELTRQRASDIEDIKNGLIAMLQEIYRYIYQTGNNVSQATVKIENELPETTERNHILEFIRSSSRGIVRGNMEG